MEQLVLCQRLFWGEPNALASGAPAWPAASAVGSLVQVTKHQYPYMS